MIILKGKIKSFTTLKTGKIVRIFCTPNEIETISLDQAKMKDGYFAFSVDEIKAETETVMKDLKIGMSEDGKSKSQIMRGKLFSYWSDHYTGKLSFNDFYNATYDNLIKELNDKMK